MIEPEHDPISEPTVKSTDLTTGLDSVRNVANLNRLERAILKTVAYVDVYDYPLSTSELHRYLIGVKVSESELVEALNNLSASGELLDYMDGYYSLLGRARIIQTRKHRQKIAKMM